jgi:hypothetical protein
VNGRAYVTISPVSRIRVTCGLVRRSCSSAVWLLAPTRAVTLVPQQPRKRHAPCNFGLADDSKRVDAWGEAEAVASCGPSRRGAKARGRAASVRMWLRTASGQRDGQVSAPPRDPAARRFPVDHAGAGSDIRPALPHRLCVLRLVRRGLGAGRASRVPCACGRSASRASGVASELEKGKP